MKLFNFTNILVFSMPIITSGCEKEGMETFVQYSDNDINKVSDSMLATRSIESGYWESWDYITLNTGIRVNTPWNPKSTESSVPHNILEDVKSIDGWEMVFHKIEGDTENYQGNSAYLIFHNIYTGILKVFYYLSQESFHPNNHGIWQISINKPSSLFAFQKNPISTISEKDNDVYYVSNITNSSTHGFSVGWNCFQIELAYDPEQSGWMEISTIASNTVELSFSGNLTAETEGLITTSNGTNNYDEGLAKIAGDEAGKWIQNKIKDKTILGIPNSVIAEGVKSIVKGGVGSIIGAFTGLFRSDNSTKSLQLTTNGTFSFKGEATFNTPTGIPPFQLDLNPKDIGYLGAWGLKEVPTLLFSPYAVLKNHQEYSNGYTREYVANIINSHNAYAEIVFNPKLNSGVASRTISIDYFKSSNYTKKNIWRSNGVLGRDQLSGSQIYDNLYKADFKMIADIAFRGNENEYLPIDQYEPPMEVFIPDVPNGPQGASPNIYYHSRYLASIGIMIKLPNGSEAYSYHHCVPNIDWNLSEYNNGLYWSFYPCVPVEQKSSYWSVPSSKQSFKREITNE